MISKSTWKMICLSSGSFTSLKTTLNPVASISFCFFYLNSNVCLGLYFKLNLKHSNFGFFSLSIIILVVNNVSWQFFPVLLVTCSIPVIYLTQSILSIPTFCPQPIKHPYRSYTTCQVNEHFFSFAFFLITNKYKLRPSPAEQNLRIKIGKL